MDKIFQLDNEFCIQIAGPTASGKSALALKIAQIHNGEIINTDSMQVYNVLNQITARPSHDDLNKVPHHLYGYIAPGSQYSTGHWIRDVKLILRDIVSRGKIPVFVGGTGLYFKALNEGLADIPPIPKSIHSKWQTRLKIEGIEVLYQELLTLDPSVANKLKPADKQRITRALEVLDATGISIEHFHRQKSASLVAGKTTKKILLHPDRSLLHHRIERRFHYMIHKGAIDEVKELLTTNTDPSHSSMKAIGVREISHYLAGHITLDKAIQLSITATRQYAKRQSTWFRNQLSDEWLVISNL